MANNSSATPITTGSVTAEPKKNGIYYFKLDSRYFLYDGDEQRICGLSGAEIDSDLHFLSGMDIKDVVLNPEEGTITISRVNGEDFSAITLDIKETHPKSLVFSADTGELFLEYPDGTTLRTEGFFVDFNDEGKYNVKIYTDGTLDGLGDMYRPLSLSRLERTGTFAPVETVIDGPITSEYLGHRVLTKEPVDDFGHLYPYQSVEDIQAALEAENSPWRVPTKKDWDELLNAMEKEVKNHDELTPGYKGDTAAVLLKSTKYWETDVNTNVNYEDHDYVGFGILPVGSKNWNDSEIRGFGKKAVFWTRNDAENNEAFVKEFGDDFGGVRQDDYETAFSGNLYSIRLVKECEPGCPEQYETILGDSYPVGPIVGCFDDYCKIWTLSNFYGKVNGYEGETLLGREGYPNVEKYAYFINECDGSKKRMMEGESVVILDDEINPDRHEYRIINGELVDTQDWLDKKIIALSSSTVNELADLSAKTDTAINTVSAVTTSLFNDLSANTDTAILNLSGATVYSINKLSGNTHITIKELSASTIEELDVLSGKTDLAIQELSANTVSTITNETARAMIAEGNLNDDIVALGNKVSGLSASTKTEVERINSELNELNTKINEEIDRSTNEDNALSGRLDELFDIVSGNSRFISDLQEISEATIGELAELTDDVEQDVAETNDRITALSAATKGISDLLVETINENDIAHEQILESVSAASESALESAKAYTDEQIDGVNAVKVNDIYFDERLKYLKLLKADGTLSEGIPADEFLKDSVLTSVEYDEGNSRLIFVWNDDYTTRTYIPLERLSNVYGVGTDSLAYLKMSGTNISAIVDKADGFEKTLATTKFAEDKANDAKNEAVGLAAVDVNTKLAILTSEMNEQHEDIVELVDANTAKIETLNGDKDVAGSVKHTIDDKFNTTLLTAGLPVTNVSVDEASNNSLIRAIVVNGEIKYFVSNKAKDLVATDNGGYTIGLNHYINGLETRIAALEEENIALKNRVSALESAMLDETAVKNIVKGYLKGTNREIKLTESGGTLQIGFSDDAVFGWTM